MPRKKEIPDLEDKVGLIGKAHDLGETIYAICKAIGFPDSTLREAIKGDRTNQNKGLTNKYRQLLMTQLGLPAEMVAFYDPKGEGRDTMAKFEDAYNPEAMIPPCKRPSTPESPKPTPAMPDAAQQLPSELLKALKSEPRHNNLVVERGGSGAIDVNFGSVTLFTDQADIARISLEISASPWILTLVDQDAHPIFHREIVLLRGAIELQLGGAELVGRLEALERVVTQYNETDQARGVRFSVGGTALTPTIRFEVEGGQKDYVGLLAPGVLPPVPKDTPAEDFPNTFLCLLANITSDTEVSAVLRAYSKDFYMRPEEPMASIGATNESDGSANDMPVGLTGGRSLPIHEQQLILKHLWQQSLAEASGENRRPGQIVIAFNLLRYKERKS